MLNITPRRLHKNLGSGYTEWFFCTADEMRSCVLNAFRFIKWSKDKIGKDEEFKDDYYQPQLKF